MSLKFSIIIPLYLGERYIKETLESVMRQTYADYEIIIVDDGSPDNSQTIIVDFIEQHPKVAISYIKQKNKGLGGAKNTGLKNARGDLIAILDQDDVWFPERLKKVVTVFNSDKTIDLVCHNEFVNRGGVDIKENKYGVANGDIYKALLYQGNLLSTSATTFRKSVVERVGYFTEETKEYHFVEDYDYWLRAAKERLKFYFIDECLGRYSVHDNNFSRNQHIMCEHLINVVDHHHRDGSPQLVDGICHKIRRANIYFFNAWLCLKVGKIGRALQYISEGIFNNPLFFITEAGRIVRKRY